MEQRSKMADIRNTGISFFIWKMEILGYGQGEDAGSV
jgi:hypothetical protein